MVVHIGGQLRSVVSERIEALERVTDERQAEVRVVALPSRLDLGAHLSRVVNLRDLVDREVLRVDSAGELGLKWCTNLAKAVPVDAVKERVLLELGRALGVAETVLWVANEAIRIISENSELEFWRRYIPSDEVLRLRRQLLVRREAEVALPVNDLAVGVVRFLSAEWRPADQALEHDGAHTPPVASLVIASPTEDFGSDVVWRAHSRVRKLAPRLTPGVDLVAVGDSQLDLVNADRVAVLAHALRTVWRHELLVV